MVDKFIQDLKNLCNECFHEDLAIDNYHILFLGLTKLIDGVSKKSKSEMRHKYLEIMNEYTNEDNVFFEIYPRYKEMDNLNLTYLSGAERELYLLKPTYNGLNVSFDKFRSLDEYFIESICNWNLIKKLYDESISINGDSLNFFNISSYDLYSFSIKLVEAESFEEIDEIIDEYFKGFDIKTFTLLSYFEREIFFRIRYSYSWDIFFKLDNIQIDQSIYSEDTFKDFLSEFIFKLYCGDVIEDSFLFIFSLFNMHAINETECKVFIPSSNDFYIICHFINYIFFKKPNYNLKVFTNVNNFSFKERLMLDLISNINDVEEINEEFLNSIDAILSNNDIMEYPIVLDYFKKDNIKPISIVSCINSNYINSDNFNKILKNDYLDSIFLLKDHEPMIVLNSKKLEDRQNKFLLFYGLENNHPDEQFDLILNSFKLYQETKYSKLIFNKNINNDSLKNNFNLNNLMYDKFRKVHNIDYDENTLRKSFDNEDMEVCCLGDITNLEAVSMYSNLNNGMLYMEDDLDLSNSLILVPELDSNWTFTSERIVKSEEDFYQKNNFLLCDLTSECILKEYLFYYLNSDKGLSDLNYFKRSDFGNWENDLKYIRIPIPDIETQNKIVDTARNMDTFFNNIEIFKNDFNKNILNYKPMEKALSEFSCQIKFDELGSLDNMCSNWRVVYNGILWPLAITYLYATKKSNNYLNKKENYINLFEFYAAFIVIVLISAIPEYRYDDLVNEVWTEFRGLDNMTFGNWSFLYKKLNHFYNSHEFDTDIDKSILMNISSEKFYKLFMKLTPKRNDYKGHNSMVQEDDDENLVKAVKELEVYMNNDIIQIMKAFSNLKMYYTTGKNETKRLKGTITQELMILNGPCNPQFYYEITLDIEDKLDDNYLYLYDSSKNSFLKINDSFMKLFEDEESGEWLLYLFDGYDKFKKKLKGKSKYRCHQRFGKNVWIKDDTYLKNLKELKE